MRDTAGLFPGARIGVAVSGGEDSFTLLQVLRYRQRILPFPIELMALHINPGFEPESHRILADWCAEHGVALHAELSDHGLVAHSEVNTKNSPCFYCCRKRRAQLFEWTRQYNLSHLALGHNADDLASTFFLNLFQAGKVLGMEPAQDFFKGQFKLIRPFLWLDKATISRACRQWGLPTWKNACPSAQTSRRMDFQRWLNSQPFGKGSKRNVLNGLKRWCLDSLPGTD